MSTEIKIRRGSNVEHQSFVGSIGEITYVTDKKGLRVHDGVTVGGNDVVGEVLSTGSTTPRQLSDRLADVVNVKDYGAKGDGVTDDTASVQLALDKQGHIYFPKGIYKILGSLTVPSNVLIEGENGTVINGGLATNAGVNGSIFNVIDASNVTVKSLNFVYDTDLATSVTMFSVDGSESVRFYDNTFISEDDNDSGNTAGIRIRESSNTGSTNVIISGNSFTGPRLHILTQGGSGHYVTDVVISNNIFTANSDPAEVQNPNILDGVVKIDLYTDNVVFSDNICNGNNATEGFIQVEEVINNVAITSNVIRDCLGFGIFVYGGQTTSPVNNITIANNVLSNAAIQVADLGTTTAGEISIIGNIIDGTQDLISGAATNGISLLYGAVANIVISGNIIKNATGFGIYNRYSSAVINNNKITDCVTYGIYNQSGNNNNISGNNITMNASVSTHGIGVRTCSNALVTNNTINGTNTSATTGIILLTAVDTAVQNNLSNMANAANSIIIDSSSNHIVVSNNTGKSSSTFISNSGSQVSLTNNIDLDVL